ncbi:PD-(D/E)XK nuclease family protein [Lentibacillus sp. CBA3610]|uniref:RecB family exonuclease n=1 Tax=Lentibacillus sp. CBA3610 TaxID=2518176 RepID=UPI001594FBFF|nr:PD-(D/E)XK nuclease family protein [Lentibacillus sp. CBA3610]QKY69413.1 PD-(D/E)XK nuclease family protein [Lentibacillus sp. CBA3610]
MIFSFSRLNLYEQCPFRFYNKYILGKDEPVTQPLALGKAVHQAIDDKINGLSHEEAVLNGYAAADFHKELKQQEISELVDRAPIQLNMGETEMYFKLPLADEANAPEIQGYIDLYEDGIITDWKTNRVSYNITANKQLALYAWAISQIEDLKTVKGVLNFLRFKKESSHTFTVDDMEKARKWALELAKEINEKEGLLKIQPHDYKKLYPAKPSRLCSHCPFAKSCIKINDIETPLGV